VNPGPSGGGVEGASVVIPAGVGDVPAETLGGKFFSVEPTPHRDSIELEIVRGASLERDRECPSIGSHSFSESFELLEIILRGGAGGKESLVPTTVEEETLLR
jgi:hypothetical protein